MSTACSITAQAPFLNQQLSAISILKATDVDNQLSQFVTSL